MEEVEESTDAFELWSWNKLLTTLWTEKERKNFIHSFSVYATHLTMKQLWEVSNPDHRRIQSRVLIHSVNYQLPVITFDTHYVKTQLYWETYNDYECWKGKKKDGQQKNACTQLQWRWMCNWKTWRIDFWRDHLGRNLWSLRKDFNSIDQN